MRPRRNGSGRHRALVLVAALAACGGNVTVSRGFGSREVLPLRDPTVILEQVIDVAGQDPTLVYATEPGDAGTPAYWSLDLVTGALQDDGPNPPSPGPGPAAGGAPYQCALADLMPDGTRTLEVTDTAGGAKTDIDGVSAFVTCAGADGTLAVFRRDAATGKQVLWAGPYQRLAPIALPIDVSRLALPPGGVPGQPSAILVLAATPAQPDAVGLYAVDLDTDAVAEVVPASPASVAWAAGAPRAGSLQSSAVSADVDVSTAGDHDLYARTMADGGTTLFAGPLASGPASELALFQISASGTPSLGSRTPITAADDTSVPQPAPRLAAWQIDGANGSPSQLMVWDDAGLEVTPCPSAPNAFESGVVAADGAHALFSAVTLGGRVTAAPLQLLSLVPGQPHTCVVLQDVGVTWADFSGDGSTIAWISKTMVGLDSDLWIANSDGSNPQKVLSGQVFGARFVDGTTHLELAYGGDLVWLDVLDPNHFSYVAEELFGDTTSVGGSWFVAGYDYSSQDATGSLGVVSLDSGAKRAISPAVSQYLVAAQTMPAEGGGAFGTPTGVYHVVYLVKGRNPSPQDGIWVATVEAADLQ
jgi:hypothetical protein